MEEADMSTAKAATTKRAAAAVGDDYLNLIKRFPLRPLRSEGDLNSAGAVLDSLVGRGDLTSGQRDYVEGLARFIRDYEAQTVRNRLKRLTPLELLKHLTR